MHREEAICPDDTARIDSAERERVRFQHEVEQTPVGHPGITTDTRDCVEEIDPKPLGEQGVASDGAAPHPGSLAQRLGWALPEVAPLPGAPGASVEGRRGPSEGWGSPWNAPAAGQSMCGTRPLSAPARARDRNVASDAVAALLSPGAEQDEASCGVEAGRFTLEGLHYAMERRRQRREFVTAKVGTSGRAGNALRSDTQYIHEETTARARGIHERMESDGIGSILAWGPRSAEPATYTDQAAVAPARETRVCDAGQFEYRIRDQGTRYEIETQVRDGGRLLRVTRNPLRSTVTYVAERGSGLHREGDRSDPEDVERLVVRVPTCFDLAGQPAAIERDFAQGRLLVAFHRRPSGLPVQTVTYEDEL